MPYIAITDPLRPGWKIEGFTASITTWMPENLRANWRDSDGVTGTEILGELRHALQEDSETVAHSLAEILGLELEIEYWGPVRTADGNYWGPVRTTTTAMEGN